MATFSKEAPTREQLDAELWFSAKSPRVLWAVREVDRKFFLPKGRRAESYKNKAVQFGEGCSLSEPCLVAQMVDELRLTGEEKVLEVGTGRGYEAAILSLCAREVYTIDYNARLVRGTRRRLDILGFKNVHVECGDGCLGLPAYAPYDAIIVAASAKEIPNALIDQLAELGRIVVPTSPVPGDDELTVGIKLPHGLLTKPVQRVSFHPLISIHHGGWTKEGLEELTQKNIAWLLGLAHRQAKVEGKTVDAVLDEVATRFRVVTADRDEMLREIVGIIYIPTEELVKETTNLSSN